MTVGTEYTIPSYSLRNNHGGTIILPGACRDGLANLAVPSEADLATEFATQNYPIGTQLRLGGKLYRYSKAGEAMAAGTRGFLKCARLICPGKAGNSLASGYEAAAYAAIVAGQTYFDITDTAAAKNEYESAYAVWYDDTNNIYEDYMVIGNDATAGGFTRCYIAPPGFKAAHAAAVQVTVYRNPYVSVGSLLTAGNQSWKSALGYIKIAITSAYYFWLQTAGPISGVTGASTWPGQVAYQRDVMANTDGSIIGKNATTYLYQRVGYLLGGTASDYGDNFIMLQLDQ